MASNRLSSPAGSLVDHGHKVSFLFEGKRYEGLKGDTIASALAANGQWVLSRSFKYHRPRGALTMAGQDANTLVQIGDEPNVLADMRQIEEGLRVEGQNYKGSLDNDRWSYMDKFGRFMPVGFYYRAFYKPKAAWQRFWEPKVRKMAGLGKVDLSAHHGYFDKQYLFADVAVVGGGPAGLSAALTAAKAGAEVILIDEWPKLGGALNYARFSTDGRSDHAKRDQLIAEVEAQKNIRVMTYATANGWFGDNYIPILQGERMYKLRAKQLVLATGSLEQPAQFRNNDLPGIMLGSAAQRLIKLYGVRPGKRAVVLAGNADAYGLALDLADVGVEIAAIVDLRETPGDSLLAKTAAQRGLKIIPGHGIQEAFGTTGNKHVKGVFVSRVTGPGTLDPGGETIACDLVAVSVGYTPTYQLALQSGGKLGYDDATAHFTISGLMPMVGIAGSVNSTFTLDAVLADGAAAAWRACQALGLNAGTEPQVPADRGALGINHPWPIFKHPRGRDFVDFDEDLQVKDILNAVADGYNEVELVKRFSTVGMGPSQGRHAALTTARLVAKATGRSVATVGVTTSRPPFAPERLGLLGGRGFEQERLTAMHHRHKEMGAQMMTAGLWWRPAYYGDPAKRSDAIREEVRAVRNNVGLIDVSTLGGLDIRGPDAAEFLNRLYTFSYTKQPVGRSRYLLMTNEQGVVIDDGVACRLAEQHFYVTATTSGVDRVYRNMLWWNAQWRLDIDVAHVTNAFAGVNIAGPRSRDVLAKLESDIDFSAEAFPYMGVREGTLAGIPVRAMRVGFVGELGYELHVPTSYGEALWDKLLEAGKSFGIRPFGVEAQRVLRLEKGHIIIGQDTDAMTTPDEVQMAWAISGKKPFFVGARSIEMRRRHPSKRKLVGFKLPAGGPLPEESNLLIANGEMVGFVTSACESEACGAIVGLAYAPRETEVGGKLAIKLTNGRMLEADCVAPHFFDHENKRQEM